MRENKLLSIKTNGSSELGYLHFFEENKDIPFEIKRIYYICDVPLEKKRGMHAHKKLKQVLWCPYGEIEVVLDDGKEKTSFLLDSPQKALIIVKGYWRELYWKVEKSVLCVAASHYYDENDYIRDYTEFLEYVKEGYWQDEN